VKYYKIECFSLLKFVESVILTILFNISIDNNYKDKTFKKTYSN